MLLLPCVGGWQQCTSALDWLCAKSLSLIGAEPFLMHKTDASDDAMINASRHIPTTDNDFQNDCAMLCVSMQNKGYT